MKHSTGKVAGALLMLVLFLGCGSGGGGSRVFDFSGAWNGPFTVTATNDTPAMHVGQVFTGQLAITQDGASLSILLTALSQSKRLAGTGDEDSFTATRQSTGPDEEILSLAGTVENASTISGTFDSQWKNPSGTAKFLRGQFTVRR